jgi:hypothetical protein
LVPNHPHPRVAAILFDEITALVGTRIVHAINRAYLAANRRDHIEYVPAHLVTGNDYRYSL